MIRLFERMRQVAAGRREKPAVTFLDAGLEGRTLCFGELFAAVDRLAARLGRLGLDDGRPLGILLQSQRDQVLHYLAALQCGLVPAILTPPNRKLSREYYLETTRSVIDRCAFQAVVSDVDELHLAAPTLAPFSLEPVGATPAASGAAPLAAAFLQFSSGTTGIKRGVLVSDGAALSQVATYAGALRADDADVFLSWLPLYHDMGFVACLNMPLLLGAHVVMIEPMDWVADPGTFLRATSGHRATLAWNPNFAYAFMAQRVRDEDLDGVDLGSLRGMVNCSEPATHSSESRFLARFAPVGFRESALLGCYAMAETTFALTHGSPDMPGRLDEKGPSSIGGGGVRVSVGEALPGVELRVVNPDSGADRGDREVGEILARSPFTFSGYFNDPESTAAAFAAGGWYRTGDLGYRVGGSFFVIGRRKDVLIVGGVNVFPNDVEELVSAVAGVVPGRVSVFAQWDSRLETERVVILFETERPPAASRPVALEIRQRVLAAFQIASFETHAVAPGWLVKSTSGKMARSANRAKWERHRL